MPLPPSHQDPQSFIDNREDTDVVESDASAIWLKLRGEEPVMLCDDELQKNMQVRAVKRWHKQAEDMAQRVLVEELIAQVCEECKDIKQQTDMVASQGGDKARLTIINFMVKKNWFKHSAKPEGFLIPAILVVNADKHARSKSRSSM